MTMALAAGHVAVAPAAAVLEDRRTPARRDLEVGGLVKRFGAATVLDGVGLTVPKGEAVALIGSNGAGKSTLLRCCLRLIEPDEGSVTLLGEDLRALRPAGLRRLRRRIGFVFQKHNLVPRLSALSNVLHGAIARNGSPRLWHQAVAHRDSREEAMACLDMVGLADLAGRRADRLSGGQSQRVAIARTLMQRPDIVMADEPAASLDPVAAEEVMALLSGLMRRQGLTLIYTSHNLRHAVDYADRVIGLRGGRIAFDAPSASQDATSLEEVYG